MNSRHNWDGYSHQELYDRIHGKGGFFIPDGAGVSGASGAQDGWSELASLMARARERTEAALARAGAVWEGDAAEAMRSGVTPLAQWADDAHTASLASQSSTDTHVSAYSAAKNKMPEPVPVNSTANSDFLGIPAAFTHVLGGQTDQDKQEAAAQEAKSEAVRIMSGYESESNGAQSSVGQFVPPPSVTVDVAPTQPTGGDVPPPGATEWRDTRRPVGGGEPQPGDSHGPGATPPPGSGPRPHSGDTSVPQDTTPSTVTTPPPAVKPLPVNPPVGGFAPDQYRPGASPFVPGFSPVGTPGEQGAGGGTRGPGGRFAGGYGDGVERGPGAGRAPGRGGMAGAGGLVEEPVAGRAGATGTAGARGASGMGATPVGNRADGDEDKEHRTAEYLVSSHDSFWDDTPPVAPPVIGDEEDED